VIICSFYVSLPSISFCNLPHMRKRIGVIDLTHSQRNLSLKMIPSMILPRNTPENSVLSWASIWWARRRYLWIVTSSVTSFEISNAVTPTQPTPLHGWAEINRWWRLIGGACTLCICLHTHTHYTHIYVRCFSSILAR
jgi:hypothetical protein